MLSSLPSQALFSSTMVLGTLMALSSSQWLYIWAALELNMLSFIPLISSSMLNQESEASMKYFLAQAIGSTMLLTTVFSKLMFSPVNNVVIIYMTSISLLIKLGGAPCHLWFPPVMSNLSWPLCILLSTWQKLAPLTLLINNFSNSFLIIFFAVIGSLTGGFGGVAQTQLRSLMAYSSIGHIGWMLAASSMTVFLSYFFIYSILAASLFSFFWLLQSSTWTPNFSFLSLTPITAATLMLLTLSLAGLPPLTGFFPKFMVIMNLQSMSLMWPLCLIAGTTIQLFYYLNLSFNFLSKSSSSSPSLKGFTPSLYLSLIIAIASIGCLPLMCL